MGAPKKRDANLDLLRIVSMMLIIFLHSIDHSGVLENAERCSGMMYFYVRATYALCQVCVNCYVMLSGYYLVKSKFRLQKLVSLWMEAAFYSFALKLLFMLTGKETLSIVSLVSCFFPILTGRYWFLTIYVGLYLLSPFLNKLVCAMNRKEHAVLNLCLFVLFSLWSSLHPSIAGMNSGGGWGLAWFVVLYLAAAWFSLYGFPRCRPIVLFGIVLLLSVLMAGGQIAAGALGIGILQNIIENWFRYDSASVYLMTVCLFAGFLNIQIKSSRSANVICAIAPLTLGVYLIHAHANVSPWLWETLNLPPKMTSAWFALFQFGCVISIFAFCIVIESARRVLIGNLENTGKLSCLCEAMTNKLITRILGEPMNERSGN